MLQVNEEVFKGYRGHFFDEYEKKVLDISDEEKETNSVAKDMVELRPARDGNTMLVVTRDGVEYRCNSAFRPVEEAKKWVQQFKKEYMEHVWILFGLGNGIIAREVLNRLGKDDKLLIYEPSLEIFETVFEQVDMTDILKEERVYLVQKQVNHDAYEHTLEDLVDWKNVNSIQFLVHPKYNELYMEDYANLVKILKKFVELTAVNRNTNAAYSHLTIKNLIKNFSDVKNQSIYTDVRGGIPEGYPAIIVSAGPSLEKNIELLREAKGKAFILAVDSAVKHLVRRGIYFDAMISVDPQKSWRHLHFEECKEVPFFCVGHSSRGNMDFHEGKKILVPAVLYLSEFFKEIGRELPYLNMGGSVANSAFSLCYHMGFKRIVLIGQDLAYMGESTHAGGVKKAIPAEEHGMKMVEGVNGEKVKSRYDWLIYLDWFEAIIAQLPDIELIDATEGGALIHGTKIMTLEDVIGQYCTMEFDMHEYIQKCPPMFNEEEYTLFKDKIRALQKEMADTKREASNGIMICDEVLDLIKQCGGNINVNKQTRKLSEYNKRIEDRSAYELLEYYSMDLSVNELMDVNKMSGDKEDDLRNTYVGAKVLYEALIKGVDELKELLQEAIDNM